MKNRVLVLIFIVIGCFTNAKSQTDSINVKHYEINLNVDNIITNGHIGYTQIEFDLITKDHNKVMFSLQNQIIDSVYIGNNMVNTLPKKTNFTFEDNQIIISLPNYSIMTNYVATIYYHGASTVENNAYAWGGLHYDNDIIYSMGVAFMDYPHSYARSWFAVNESFTDKATYDLYISVNKNKEAVCSGNLIEKKEYVSFDTYHYNIPQNISPYLVAITIADFHTYTKNIHSYTYDYDIPLVVKYIYEEDLPNIEHNFLNFEKGFNALEKHFGKFKFNRIGYCVTPIGSMEHVDNISLARGAILDTTIDGISNIVHELGHSWFGNLATCENEKEMWLNEGWTTFSTYYSLQAMFDDNTFKNYWRKKHLWVLESLPLNEGNKSVQGIDSSMTYSSTVYEKGAMVAKTLQAYFSDSLFFNAVKVMLDSFAFKNYNSQQVRDFIASYTNDNNFTQFFNYLVFDNHKINYDMYQNENGEIKFKFYPDEYNNIVNIPIYYYNGLPIADFEEQFMTLNTNNYQTITQNGNYNFANTYNKLQVNNIEDSIFIHSTLHWAAPSCDSLPYGIEKLSSQHYWTIKGLDFDKADLTLSFFYELSMKPYSFDSTLINAYKGRDSLIMMYRQNFDDQWKAIPFTIPNNNKDYATTDFVFNGDYCFARGDKSKIALYETKEMLNEIKIYPNPSDGEVIIDTKNLKSIECYLFSIDGKQKIQIPIKTSITKYKFQDKGTYVLYFKIYDKIYSKVVVIK